MTKGDNAKYILCHLGTSVSEVIESKKKRDLSTTLKMTAERSFDCAQDDKGKEILSPNGSRMTGTFVAPE